MTLQLRDAFESIEWNGKNFNEIDGIEEEFSDDSGQFVERMAAFGLEPDERHEQEVDHGGPDLGQDGVFRGAEERLDFQVLLDPLEERFNLPS